MRIKSPCIGITLLLCGGTALAETADPRRAELPVPNVENGRAVYANCVGCHQPDGWGKEDGAYPQIAGQYSGVILKQMADIRAQNRDVPLMYPFTRLEHLAPGDLVDVAAYIAALPMNPRNGVGPGDDLAHGKKVYQKNCADCHGSQGQGDVEKAIPMIQGQHYAYLERQADWIRSGKRRNVDAEMTARMGELSAKDVSAVMDYVSRLRPLRHKLADAGWENPDFPKFVQVEPAPLGDVCKVND